MSKTQEALKLALEALEPFITPNWAGTGVDKANKAYAAIREALAEQQLSEQCRCGKQTNAWCMSNTCSKAEQPAQQQEPVAWQWLNTAHFRKHLPKDAEHGAWNPLYTSPPPRKPLTTEQIIDLWNQSQGTRNGFGPFARAIEAAHGIKGEA